MADVQLILYPQVYAGYFQQTITQTTGAPNNTGTPTNPVGPSNPILPANPTPNLVGNAIFNTNPISTTQAETPIAAEIGVMSGLEGTGMWSAFHGQNANAPAKNTVSADGSLGSLRLGGHTGGEGEAYSGISQKVEGFIVGQSYRVIVGLKRKDVAETPIAGIDTAKFYLGPQHNKITENKAYNAIQGSHDAWRLHSNGTEIGNLFQNRHGYYPNGNNTEIRIYQEFVASATTHYLQLSYLVSNNNTPIITIDDVIICVAGPPNQAQATATANAGIAGDGTAIQVGPATGVYTGTISTNTPVITGTGTTGGPSGPTPTMTSSSILIDGQVICDLYTDASIPLNLSVDNFVNVDEKIASYSKSFLLPATKKNNKIFSHYFDVTRSQGADVFTFNPYAKTACKVKDDGILIFEGWLRLLDVQEKEGQISYNVNCYSDPTTFCDYLKARKMSDLDLDELAHDYTHANVVASTSNTSGLTLTNPLPITSHAYDASVGVNNTQVIRYPFVNWMGNFSLENSSLFRMHTLEQAFRPFINCLYLLKKMFDATPYTFESTFLESANFNQLFMDFNFGADLSFMSEWVSTMRESTNELGPVSTGAFQNMIFPDLETETPSGVFTSTYDLTTGEITIPRDNTKLRYTLRQYFLRDNKDDEAEFVVEKDTGSGYVVVNGPFDIHFPNFTTVWSCTTGTGVISPSTSACRAGRIIAGAHGTVHNLMQGDKVRFRFRQKAGGGQVRMSKNSNLVFPNNNFGQENYSATNQPAKLAYRLSGGTTTIAVMMAGIRGDMSQYDFWKGIKDMFNLVTMSSKEKNQHLIIEPYNDIFIDNPDQKTLDWTSKLDTSNLKIKPLTKIPKRTKFTYEDDEEDYRLQNYKNALGGSYLYGTKTFEAGDTFFSILTGSKEIKASPFAPTIAAPLTNIWNDFVMSHVYKMDVSDEGVESFSFDNKPRILHWNGQRTMTQCSYEYFDWFNFNIFTGTTYGLMTHLSEVPTTGNTLDYNFGECPLVNPVGASPVNNLFNVYWKPYYDELYTPDTKTVNCKMLLSPADIEMFNFYDIVIVKNRHFRVNKIEYKSGELAKVELILIT